MREGRAIKQNFELPSIYKDFALASNNLLPACSNKNTSCLNSSTKETNWAQYCQ
jgi:hypothetical protein